MQVYLSFSTKLNRPKSAFYKPKVELTEAEKKQNIIKLFEVAVGLLNKFNYNINIITDNEGFDWLKHLQVNSITKELEPLNFKYNDVWSISKLHVFNIISNRKKPFIHIDHDFFVLQPFRQEILDADVVVQSIEFNLDILGYATPVFNALCINKYYAENSKLNYAYNCGIIGGKNYEFFKEYTDSAIKMVNDPANKVYWNLSTNEYSIKDMSKAVIAEQYYLACCLDKFNIKPTLFFDNSKTKINYHPSVFFHYNNQEAVHLFGHVKEIDEIRNSLDLLTKKISSV
jgi:hypothetical protein